MRKTPVEVDLKKMDKICQKDSISFEQDLKDLCEDFLESSKTIDEYSKDC